MCWFETLTNRITPDIALDMKRTDLVCKSCLIGRCECKGKAVTGMTCAGYAWLHSAANQPNIGIPKWEAFKFKVRPIIAIDD